MVDEDYISGLKKLLELQKTGELNDLNNVKEFTAKYLVGENLDRNAPNTDYRILNIMNEWKSMYSFSPGLTKGVDLIIDLLNRIIEKPDMDILEFYKLEEWKRVVNLRGPVETIIEKQCEECSSIFYTMGVSGFLDGVGLVCDKCGDVFFKSFYDDTKTPDCSCGGHYKDGCPLCGHNSAVTVGYKSPYWYFENHRYTRGKWF